jgi:hypothetical protein
MKPLWTPTLVWIAAVLAATLFALASPGGFSFLFDNELFSHGAIAPR